MPVSQERTLSPCALESEEVRTGWSTKWGRHVIYCDGCWGPPWPGRRTGCYRMDSGSRESW